MADLYERLRRFQKNTTQGACSEPSSPAPASSSPLPEALKNIPGLIRARDLVSIAEKRDEAKNRFLESLEVCKASNDRGSFGVRETSYATGHLLYPPDDIRGPELALLCGDPSLDACRPEEILFLDTETTGLAGGTGTVPFLMGAGFFQEGFFRVRQFFLRDYGEEPAVLDELARLLDRFPVIATYNGKSFDVPLLHTRFLLNRQPNSIRERPHADFLHPARRFWRGLLPDCTLLQVEAYLKGESRDEDIPGEMIPYVYFDYLRGLRLPRLRPVFLHNAEDILSLALIASRLCRLVRFPLPDSPHCQEIAAAGRCYASVGDWKKACRYLETAFYRADRSEPNRLSWGKMLSSFYKKMDCFEEARQWWLRLAEEYEDPFPHIELAKYYEHKNKEISLALHHTHQALSLIHPGIEMEFNEEDIIQKSSSIRIQLNYRMKRLQRKAGLLK